MKTVKITKNIESILNVTKNVIKQSSEFNDYYQNKDNNLYQNQLPLLMQRSRIREALYFKNRTQIKDLVLHKTTTEEQDSNDILGEEEEKNIYNKLSLTGIRKLQIRSKKLPPLCPFYNKKGELLPHVVSTSKALSNIEVDSKINLSKSFGKNYPNSNWHFLTPMNKDKIKHINLYENVEVHFDEFQREVLYEKKYDTLNYNYSDIYGREQYYKEYINNLVDEINNLTNEKQLIEEKNKIVENQEIKKEKVFEWGKNKKDILLTLNSINIKIKSTEDDSTVFEYNLPLNLIPLFYYKGIEKFKYFIMSLIHWDEETKKFELEENIYIIINNLLNNCKELKLKNDILEELEISDDKIAQPAQEFKKANTYGKNIMKSASHNLAKSMFSGVGSNNTLFAGTNVDIIQKKKIEKTKFKLNSKEEKDDDYLYFNIFNFYWKTQENLFKVCIESPLIIFNIPSYNITVKQYIDFELLFYLFSINFDTWDFYVIKNISSFKIFRIILSQISSFNRKKDINIFLEKPKSKNYDFSDEKIINIFTMNNAKTHLIDNPKNKKALNNPFSFDKIEEDEKEHNDSDILEETAKKEMNTQQTEETIINKNDKKIKNGINTIIEQKCFKAIVTVTDTEKYIGNEYEIFFNYNQFNKLKFISNYMNKISFLIKFMDVNYENLSLKFDYDSLNSFNEKDWISQLEKYNFNFKSIMVNNIISSNNTSTNSGLNIKPKKINIGKLKEIKEEEKINQNNNTNNPNRAEFIGDSNKNSLIIELKEPIIVIKYFEKEGKTKAKKYNILENDENKIILKKNNILNVVNNIYDLSTDYIKKEKDKEKRAEATKSTEKNLYYSYNKKMFK